MLMILKAGKQYLTNNFLKMNTLSILTKDWAIRQESYMDQAKRLHKAETADFMSADAGGEVAFNVAEYYHVRRDMIIDENGIAHIHVFGPLLNNPEPYMMMWKDVTSYQVLAEEMKAAQKAYSLGQCSGIIFDLETPGGMVAGLDDVARMAADLAALMPCVGYSSDLCCSAGYYFAAALGMENFFVSSSSDVGNIGTIIRYYDYSAYFESIGILPSAITNDGADLKSTFSLSGLTEGQLDFLQQRVNDMGLQFREQVEKYRTVDPEVFRAGWYSGAKAIELGLADYVASREDAYDTLLGSVLM